MAVSKSTKSIEDIIDDYADDKNSMIAISETEKDFLYEDFYDEFDNRIKTEQSMNMIFFGPPSSFMRIDPETILHIFTNTKKRLIPISRALLAWDLVTDGKTAAFLQGREYLAFGSLLNVIPEEDLYYVNFGDLSVLKYFANNYIKLQPRKFGVLVAAYRRYYGNRWHTNGSYINELGYLLCGFPLFELEKISANVFKELNVEVLSKLERCTYKQIRTLYNIATDPDAYGKPYMWSSQEVTKLNALFACIPVQDISSMNLEAITAVSPQVMKKMDQNKLEYFTKQQIMRMIPKTRRIYILRMQLRNSLDMGQLTKKHSCRVQTSSVPVLVLLFVVLLLSNV